MSHPVMRLAPGDSEYPAELYDLTQPPATTVVGRLGPSPRVAVVGTRKPTGAARAFAQALGRSLSAHGVCVVSGGALGIDAAAHLGALEGGAGSLAVLPTGYGRVYPKSHAPIFDRIADANGGLVHPFEDHRPATLGAFFRRNSVLVALSSAVVVVQAGYASGAMNAAMWARRLKRPLFVVPSAPWESGFEGGRALLERGATALYSERLLLVSLGLSSERPGNKPRPRPERFSAEGRRSLQTSLFSGAGEPSDPVPALSPDASAVLDAVSGSARHQDEIAARSHRSPPLVAEALLTLALHGVVVEGPPGFYARNPYRPET